MSTERANLNKLADRVEGALLPCPFCGGEATFEQIGSVALQEGCAWSVGCVNEECHGFQSVTTYARKCEAAIGWNTRAALTDVIDDAGRGK